MAFSIYLTGFSMGLSLIVAIGAQNAFVLRQGLRGEHIFLVCFTCAASDAVLITLGVTSFAKVVALLPWLDPVMRAAGAGFLLWYGARSIVSAFRSRGALDVGASAAAPLSRVLFTCLALTWLNPHVYLDTVVLLGTISTQFEGEQPSFAGGAATASFLFFFSLGYGARFLRPLFAKPAAWRLLEAAIGLTMWAIALKLILIE